MEDSLAALVSRIMSGQRKTLSVSVVGQLISDLDAFIEVACDLRSKECKIKSAFFRQIAEILVFSGDAVGEALPLKLCNS